MTSKLDSSNVPLRVYLDSSTLRRMPMILASKQEGIELVIPKTVWDELHRPRWLTGKRLKRLLNLAVKSRFAVIEESADLSVPDDPGLGLKGAGLAIAAQAASSDHPRKAVVTEDRDIVRAALALGVEAMSPRALFERLSSAKRKSREIEGEAEVYQHQSWAMAVGLGGALPVSGYQLSFATPAVQFLIGNLTIIATTILAMIAALALFALRSRKPLVYGSLEVLVGIATVSAGARSFRAMGDASSIGSATVLAILAGIYVVVRGFDNMQRGARGTRLEGPFSWIVGRGE